MPAPDRKELESSQDMIVRTAQTQAQSDEGKQIPEGKEKKRPVVRLEGIFDEFDKAVHQTLPKPSVLGDKPIQAESARRASRKEEAMEVWTDGSESLPLQPSN